MRRHYLSDLDEDLEPTTGDPTMMTLAFRVLILIALSLLCACSTLERNPATTQLVTQYAVAKYLEQRPDAQRYEAAQRIIRIAQQLQGPAADRTATLATLRSVVEGIIAQQSLSPADFVAANGLANILLAEVESRLKPGLMDPLDSVAIEQVLQWVVLVARTVPVSS